MRLFCSYLRKSLRHYVLLLLCMLAGLQPFHANAQNVTVAGAVIGNGSYPTLQAAFTAINGGLQTGANIIVSIVGNTTETGSAVLNQSVSAWNSLRIVPSGGVARTISGNLAAPLVDFNGADRVRVDGLNSGGNSLTFSNASTSNLAATFRFRSDALNDTLINLRIEGTSRGTFNTNGDGATIWFFNGTTSGNDYNRIENCDIAPVGASFPHTPIKSFANTGGVNDNISIVNNRIFDYFSTSAVSNAKGILAFTGSSGWTITGNRIYQTGTRLWTTGGSGTLENIYNCIQVEAGSGYTITNNVLGFANSSGTGYTVIQPSGFPTNNYASMIQAIIFNPSTNVASTISNNTIGGFDLTSSRSKSTAGENIFFGIYITGQAISQITVSNNTIGSLTANSSIIIRSTALTIVGATVPAAGIYMRHNFAATQTISGNNIGGIDMIFGSPGNAGTDRTSFYCIYFENSGATTVENNTIGGTLANSITSNMAGLNGNIVGIWNNSGLAQHIIRNNTIQNLTHTGNNTSTAQDASIVGICERPSTGTNGAQVTGNIIRSLANTYSATATNTRVIGLFWVGPTSGSTPTSIQRNWIYDLSTATGAGTINGMLGTVGTMSNLYNNMISLGTTQTVNATINGIEQTGGGVTGYFNTVRITGAAASGSSNAIAYHYNTGVSNALILRNNLFYNDRTGGTGLKLAIRMNQGAVPAYDNTRGTHNLLYSVTGTFAQFNATNCTTIAAWSGVCGGGDPVTSSKTAQIAFTSATDLHTTDLDVRNCGTPIVGVTNDFDNSTRPACVDIGCDETFLPLGTTYTWVGAVDDKWCTPCNWDREAVPSATDDAVIPPSMPRYPLLQAGAGCGNVAIRNFTVQFTFPSTNSGQIDLATYTLTVNGNIDFAGTCNCTGASGGGLLTEGLIDIASTTQQQIVDIRAANNSYPGTICKLRINKVQPVAAANAQEALLKGNLNILYNFDIANGVLLSQNGATYDADENTGLNFKTINILSDDVNAVTRQAIPTQDTRNGFFEGRLNRKITNVGTKNEYLFPLGFRRKTFSGSLGDYFYTPSLISFNSVTNANRFVVGTFLNSNNNFMVDGVWIGTTGHGCGNPFEIDDQGGPTASTCLDKEIDMIGDYYWDFQENNGPDASGNPAISPGALGGVDYDIQLVGDKVALMALDGLTGSELRVVKRPSVAVPDSSGQGPWVTTQGTHSGADLSFNPGMAMYSVSNLFLQGGRRDGLTSFSGFALTGNGPSPLPVELLAFNARKQGDKAVLCEWSTASEINNDYFEVEVSRGHDGGLSYQPIGRVPGRGTTTETSYYQLKDEHPVSGINYYRLRQVDFDGTASYSDPVAVLFNDDAAFELVGLAPNPCREETRALLYAANPGELKIQLSDVSGRVLAAGLHWLDIGSATVRIPLPSKTAAGVYTLRFDFEGQVRFAKLVVE